MIGLKSQDFIKTKSYYHLYIAFSLLTIYKYFTLAAIHIVIDCTLEFNVYCNLFHLRCWGPDWKKFLTLSAKPSLNKVFIIIHIIVKVQKVLKPSTPHLNQAFASCLERTSSKFKEVKWKLKERDRDRERQRQRQRERQREKERERHTHTHTQTERQRERDRERERKREREREREGGWETERQTDRQTDRKTERQRETERDRERQRETERDRDRERQREHRHFSSGLTLSSQTEMKELVPVSGRLYEFYVKGVSSPMYQIDINLESLYYRHCTINVILKKRVLKSSTPHLNPAFFFVPIYLRLECLGDVLFNIFYISSSLSLSTL